MKSALIKITNKNNILLIVLTIVLFFTIYQVSFYRYQNHLLSETNKDLLDKLKEKEYELSIIGQQIELNPDELEYIQRDQKFYSEESDFTLFTIFSMYECGTCLESENSEWERIHQEFSNVRVVALCVDNSKTNGYRFISTYRPNYTVVWEKNMKILNQIKGMNNTINVYLLDGNNNIVMNYTPEVGNELKRSHFYSLLRSAIDN